MLGSTEGTFDDFLDSPRRIMEAVEIQATPTPAPNMKPLMKRKASQSSISEPVNPRNVRAKADSRTTTALNSRTTAAARPTTRATSSTAATTRRAVATATVKPVAAKVTERLTRPRATNVASTNAAVTRRAVPARAATKPPVGTTRTTRSASAPPVSDEPEVKKEKPKGARRPAWDTKGRLEDMEELTGFLKEQIQQSTDSMTTMHSKLSSSESKIQELEEFRRGLETRVEVKEKENTQINLKATELESKLELLEQKNQDELRLLKLKHENELEEVARQKERILREKEDLTNDLTKTKELLRQQEDANLQLRNTISSQSANYLQLESDHRAVKNNLETTESTLKQREARIAELEALLTEANQTVTTIEGKLRDEETQRRKLHNTIQELKGNIRVFCRVRPLLGAELSDSISHIHFPDDQKSIELNQTQTSADGSKTTSKTFPFQFDKVFQPTVSQPEVFGEISQLVQSALDGYPVCIFAYGQTGSGKTFTMEGPDHPNKENMGMIPRAVMQIYETATALEEKGWKYTMEGQFVEIYNEAIHDLLGAGEVGKKHDIRHLPNGKTILTDVTTLMLDTPDKVSELMKKAGQNRAVAATQCNDRSSRSHSVFTLRLTGNNTLTGEVSEGILNLIDLAGSERLSSSKATGDRLKETQAINKSLSSLGDVIYALANKESHIPYRNSKLTYLLQNSLGGNSKTLMFVNISPLPSNFGETLCSLRFATKVNNCQIGTARKVVK
ncbi:kinesin-domain-containing protein [Basidiobolus meristosporus CBS 931.73]|uniref:Kinesin-domain-containing protein n=1 Tax=Basidiobolus meristosporus CBS 931.73 TaxID=1314790 RepID=A0A1Y1Y7R2_9FUNG|nr:kinesin-domain-containing protein [Basidiobolus meristosporus CBS 931.73]|eukprot:ORX94060.1 kinesin-domain-containing protein [Basidiobolus meristosporus CBS 931.73]